MAKKLKPTRAPISEVEIDTALAELVYLKDGENDVLGKLLGRTIKLLKMYRQDRICYQRLASDYKKLIKTIKSLGT